jgi:hypothetical protein
MKSVFVILAATLTAVVVPACAEQDVATPWQIQSVSADSGRVPLAAIALGTELEIGESRVDFTLAGATVSRAATVSRTGGSTLIELKTPRGSSAQLTLRQRSDNEATLTWAQGNREITAELTR